MVEKNGQKIMWFELFFVASNVLVVILFYQKIFLTTALLTLITILGMIRWKSVRTLSIFILAGIGGTVLEVISIHFGVWQYNLTNFFNVPFWLFILWGNSAAIIYRVAIHIKERRIKDIK